MSMFLAQFLSILIAVVLVSTVPLVTVIVLIWVERKIAARIQDRIGPNRVGPFGLFQTFADMIKLIIKEDITPDAADRVLYNVAPILSFASVVLIWAVIPFTPYHVGASLDTGALYFVAVASLGTLAIMTAGWASNNKYALLGAFRVVALLVSYEIPLVFALLVPVLLAGSMNLNEIIYQQSHMWFVFMAPIAAIIFYVSAQAETGRAPFDLIEAESELVAGFNIEYSGMKFGMFFAAEFLHVFTNGILMAILYFGGWLGPFYDAPLIGFMWLGIKGGLIYATTLWVRNTLPRLRIDQVMNLNWKFLVPISIVQLLLVSLIVKVMQLLNLVPMRELPDGTQMMDLQSGTLGEVLPLTIVLLFVNLAIGWYVVNWIRNRGREEKQTELATVSAAGD